jgi:hypothetical protein
MARFPKYHRRKKDTTGLFFAVQMAYPMSPATIKIEIKVLGGSRIVLEMGKS